MVEHFAATKYVALAGIILFGAISHAIQDARKYGWKGFGWFVANTFVAAFVGMVFANIASFLHPEWMYAAGGVGGYMGPVAFKYVRMATLTKLGVSNKEDKE